MIPRSRESPERSIDFYTKVLGMKLLRRSDYPGGRFNQCLVGYDDEFARRRARTHPQLGHEGPTISAMVSVHVAGRSRRLPTRRASAVKRAGRQGHAEAGSDEHGTTVIASVEGP